MKTFIFLLFVLASGVAQAQKLAAIGNMMAGYGITLKPNQ